MARARAKAEEEEGSVCGKESPRPSPVAYMGGRGGEWDPVVAVWPGVAEPTGRPIGRPAQWILAREARRVTWGPSPAVTLNRAWVVGPSALTTLQKNRKRRATWVGQNGGRGNRWKAIGSYQIQIGKRSDFWKVKREIGDTTRQIGRNTGQPIVISE